MILLGLFYWYLFVLIISINHQYNILQPFIPSKSLVSTNLLVQSNRI